LVEAANSNQSKSELKVEAPSFGEEEEEEEHVSRNSHDGRPVHFIITMI